MFNFDDLGDVLNESEDEEVVGHPLIVPATRTRFYASVKQQSFPFRLTLINYIVKNPFSHACYQKLIKTCKFFFIKNPIIFASKLYTRSEDDKWVIRVNEESIDVADISGHVHIWITDEIEIASFSNTWIFEEPREPNFISSIMPRIYKSDIEYLNLSHHNILFDDLIFIASKCKLIYFSRVTVTNKDGSIVSLEKLVQAFPQLGDMGFVSPEDADGKVITSKTVEELIKIPHFTNFDNLSLHELPEIFDIDKFYDYIKGNTTTTITLEFREETSVEYQNHLQEIVDEIVAAENHNFEVPKIIFPLMNLD